MTLTQRLIGHIPLNVNLDVIIKQISTYMHTHIDTYILAQVHMYLYMCNMFLILG